MSSPTEVAEYKFSEQASAAHATFVDMNIPMARAVAECQKMLAARSALLGMYGMSDQTGGSGGKSWGKGSWAAPQGSWAAPQGSWAPAWPMQAAASQGTGDNAKVFLMEALQHAAKEAQSNITKGQVVYESTGDKTNGFTSTLTAPDWLVQQYVGESYTSKKEAECAAAQQALQAHYPEWLKGAPGKSNKAAAGLGRGGGGGGAAKVQKPSGETRAPSPKNEVVRLMQMLLGRSLTKDDVLYTDAEGSSTLTFPGYSGKAFAGAGAEPREAQAAAATAALDFLGPLAAALPPKEPKEPRQKKRKAGADGEAGEFQPPTHKSKKRENAGAAMNLDPVMKDLVNRVKNVQKTVAGGREAWGTFADTNCEGVRDPAKSDSTTLQSFLLEMGA